MSGVALELDKDLAEVLRPLFEFVRYASRLGIPFLDMPQDEFEAELRETKTLQ
jgi:hypothetical protein